MTIETKTAKNGATIWYVDGKRVSKNAAIEAAQKNAEEKMQNLFDEFEKETGAESTEILHSYSVTIAGATEILVSVGGMACGIQATVSRDYKNIDVAVAAARYIANKLGKTFVYSSVVFNDMKNATWEHIFQNWHRVEKFFPAYYEKKEAEAKAQAIIAETDGSEEDDNDNAEVFNLLPAISELNDVELIDDNSTIEGTDLDETERAEYREAGCKFIFTVAYLNNFEYNRYTDHAVKTIEQAINHLQNRMELNYNHEWAIKDINGNVIVKGDNATDFYKFLVNNTDGSEEDDDREEISAVIPADDENDDDELIDEPEEAIVDRAAQSVEDELCRINGKKVSIAEYVKFCKDIIAANEPIRAEAWFGMKKELAADNYEEHDAWLDEYEDAGFVIRECVSDIEKLTGEIVPVDESYLEYEEQVADNDSANLSDSKAEPKSDDFTSKLAELKAAADEAYSTFIKAQEAYEQTKNALENFLNNTAFKLKQKLDELPLDYTITLKKTSGCTYCVADFSEIYLDAYRIGCDVEFRFDNWKGKTIARYDTPEQVETVINRLKQAIERGDKEFTFPTVEELNRQPTLNETDNIKVEIKPKVETKSAKHQDSLARAMKIALDNIQSCCREHNFKAACQEMTLYNICSNALRDLRNVA